MSTGQLIQIWTLDKKNELMTIGMSTKAEVCHIHGQVPKGCMWSRERLTKIQTTSLPDHIWPGAWTRIEKAAQRREKQNGQSRNQNSNMLQNVRRVYSIDPSDEDYKDTIKNARRKLETPTATATPCKRELSKANIRKTVVPKTGIQSI